MADFSNVGAVCSQCGTNDFLPVKCNACSRQFCNAHYRFEAHACDRWRGAVGAVEASAAPRAPSKRCVAQGCREVLLSHNTWHCQRCNQDVCLRHRFEDDHPCVPLDVAVLSALEVARQDLGSAVFVEAHRTLLKVFENILRQPDEAKFRTLRKANAVVQEKLCHHTCIDALKLCGFIDTGEPSTLLLFLVSSPLFVESSYP